jgi:hypothetical protein
VSEQQLVDQFYAMGQALRLSYRSFRELVMYANLPRECDDMGVMIALQAGFEGREKPYQVRGWRYGHIMSRGRSHNYADDRPEPGVSLMATDCGLTTGDQFSALFIEAKGAPKVRVEGWLNTVKRGSDGEPLVFLAREVR